MAQQDKLGDERLKRDAGSSVRDSRDSADANRKADGMDLSAEERRAMLRQTWVQEILPTPPNLPGFHCCWLSTTNSTDPVYKRMQRGYMPVKANEVPEFGTQYKLTGGEFEGCVACNEMLLFKVPVEIYNDLMTIYHHDVPLEQEETIRESVNSHDDTDNAGRKLGMVEGDFNKLGRGTPRRPTFI